MSTVPVYTLAGEKSGEFELAADIFDVTINEALVHQAVVATLANRRQGTADTKTRGEVKHTTKKVYRQKGTGRARQGMRSAPHWKGGGVVFGPHPRSYAVSLPKKMRRAALLSALTSKAHDEAIFVVDRFAFDAPKTSRAAVLLKALQMDQLKVLVVLTDFNGDGNAALSFRNLPNVMTTTADMLGTYDTLVADCLLFDLGSIQLLQELKRQPLGIARWMAKQAQGGVA